MEFKRQARDRTKKIIEVGDIISLKINESRAIAVVTGVRSFGREVFPEINITTLMDNWRGNEVDEDKKVLQFNEYRNCRILDHKLLREDVRVNKKALSIRDTILTRK